MALGKDDRLGLNRIDIVDPQYQDEENSLFHRSEPLNFRNSFVHWTDNRLNETVQFGTRITQTFGGRSFSTQLAQEQVIVLPRLVDSGAANTHPSDAAYIGNGGLGTFLDWVPFIGERIQSDESGRVVYSVDSPLRKTSSLGTHVKRTLCQDTGHNIRTAYLNAVRPNATSAATSLLFVVPCWMPWSKDGIDYEAVFPMHILPNVVVVDWDMPRLLLLIQTDVAAGNVIVDPNGNGISLMLRDTFVTMEKGERATHAMATLQMHGTSWAVTHIHQERAKQSINADAQDVIIQMQAARLPTTHTAVVVLYRDDIKAVGVASDFVDPVRSPAGVVIRPDWTNFLPITDVTLLENNVAASDVMSKVYWDTSLINGYVSRFKGTYGTNIAVLTYNISPANEVEGLGHVNFNSMQNPEMRISLPAAPVGSVRQIDILHFTRNTLVVEQGTVYLGYKVL